MKRKIMIEIKMKKMKINKPKKQNVRERQWTMPFKNGPCMIDTLLSNYPM